VGAATEEVLQVTSLRNNFALGWVVSQHIALHYGHRPEESAILALKTTVCEPNSAIAAPSVTERSCATAPHSGTDGTRRLRKIRETYGNTKKWELGHFRWRTSAPRHCANIGPFGDRDENVDRKFIAW
jgi:hypothetical protein